jgi:hypothetical protein
MSISNAAWPFTASVEANVLTFDQRRTGDLVYYPLPVEETHNIRTLLIPSGAHPISFSKTGGTFFLPWQPITEEEWAGK